MQNFVLELINGSIAILTFFLLFFLAIYLKYDIQREGFTFKNFFLLSTAASLVTALFLEKIGTLATRTIIWAWRVHGGKLPFQTVENVFLIAGALFTALGLILITRVLSRPRFGNWPWLASMLVALGYVCIEVFVELMR